MGSAPNYHQSGGQYPQHGNYQPATSDPNLLAQQQAYYVQYASQFYNQTSPYNSMMYNNSMHAAASLKPPLPNSAFPTPPPPPLPPDDGKNSPNLNQSPQPHSLPDFSTPPPSAKYSPPPWNNSRAISNGNQSWKRNNFSKINVPHGSNSSMHNQSRMDTMHINKKSKRKPMSTRYTRAKEWCREDAIRAVELERDINQKQCRETLMLKFPDPDLNSRIVKSFSSEIDKVHFQQPSTPRFCYVTLKAGSDAAEVQKLVSQISFGTGKVIVKRHSFEDKIEVAPEEIDPYTLYIGNLPTKITVSAVKKEFPTAQRIDIGFAQRMKYTRYAFIRYANIEESLEAFRKAYHSVLESRTLIVRFRRQKGTVGLPGEVRPPPNPPFTKEKMALNSSSPMAVTPTSLLNNSARNQPESDLPSLSQSISTRDDVETDRDNKADVLREAEKLMQNAASTSSSQGTLLKQEDRSDANLFDLRVKDEPIDDDVEENEDDYFEEDSEDEFDDMMGMNDNAEDYESYMRNDDTVENMTGYQMFHHNRFLADLNRKERKPNKQVLDQKIQSKSNRYESFTPAPVVTSFGSNSQSSNYNIYEGLNPDEDLDF